jgi:hypothetical protein
MDWTIVKSQAEFDAAIAAGSDRISLEAAITIDVCISSAVRLVVKAITGGFFRARGSSHVEARESSHVVAWESSHVEARDSSHVEARGSSHVEARDSSHVEAWESSHVEARGSSHVEAWESSHVVASAAASLALFGASVSAKAAAMVAVQLHRGATCDGGHQITIVAPVTSGEWCDYYGVEVVGSYALLFKGVDEDFLSPHGTVYAPGTESLAGDWDGGITECGGGLHFSPTPAATLEFNGGATKYVACLVSLADIAVHPNGDHPNKVKARACWNHYECDVAGKVIGAKYERPAEPAVVDLIPTRVGLAH